MIDIMFHDSIVKQFFTRSL